MASWVSEAVAISIPHQAGTGVAPSKEVPASQVNSHMAVKTTKQ